MSCCGSRRAGWRSAAATPSLAAAPPVPATPQNPVRLGHRGSTSTVVRGARSGFTYLFGPSGSTLEVDGADADALLATDRFERR